MVGRHWILATVLLALAAPAWAASKQKPPLPRAGAGGRDVASYEALRAYPGAPPVYVHDLGGDFDLDRQTCLGCHADEAAGAPITPHPGLPECRQCHVMAKSRTLFRPTGWAAVSRPKPLVPALTGAPPAIPHDLDALRSTCVACHTGPAALAGIRTPHPERTNCLQCHVRVVDKGTWRPE